MAMLTIAFVIVLGYVSRGTKERFAKNISFRIPITQQLSPRSPSFDLHYYNNSSMALHAGKTRKLAWTYL